MDSRRGYYPEGVGVGAPYSSSGSSLDGPEWENSFSQILNRTRQNINRISQRYGQPENSNSNNMNMISNNLLDAPPLKR